MQLDFCQWVMSDFGFFDYGKLGAERTRLNRAKIARNGIILMSEISAEKVKELARAARFDLCGITTPEAIGEAVERFESWLDRGYHAEMDWLANRTDRRTDPTKLLPGVRSIIMLGLNYYQPDSEEIPPRHGRVSNYARGRDYHKVIAAQAKNLICKLGELAPGREEHQFYWYVDYGPMLERAYAEKAGLGFIGKNSMLINKTYGSWVFLSEILTTLEIEPDRPDARAHGDCGKCTMCIDSCPTGAIIPGRTVDSSRCISYLTIERPSEIKPELAAKFGPTIFGCDICQQVCPYNRKSLLTTIDDFVGHKGVGEFVDTDKVLAMESREEFLEMTAGTPLVRPRLENLKRNAQIVLDNEARDNSDQN